MAITLSTFSGTVACGPTADDAATDDAGAADGDVVPALGAIDDVDTVDDLPDVVSGLGDAVAEPLSVGSICVVTEEPDLATIAASAHGVIITTQKIRGWSATSRLTGKGCALEPSPIATSLAGQRLLDMDDSGALYTANEGYWNTVTRTSLAGEESTVINAGRGIWSFGISGDGGRFVSSACGPTGIFDRDDATFTPLYDMAGAEGGVLINGGDAYISVDWTGTVVISDAEGSRVVDGVNAEGARLARCGDAACLFDDERVVIVDDDGVFVASAAVLGVNDGDRIAAVGAADHHEGLYLLVRADGAYDRVVYAAFGASGTFAQ